LPNATSQTSATDYRALNEDFSKMLHTAAELQDRAKQCRERASQAPDSDVRAEMLELAIAFDEEAAKVEREGTFEDGYEDGWSSVAGTDPSPENPTEPLPSEERTPEKGYLYGISDAKEDDKRQRTNAPRS
jgi:hypothetical protein